MNYYTRHLSWPFKVISVIVTITFTLNSFTWASPLKTPQPHNLQVESIFSRDTVEPLLESTFWYTVQAVISEAKNREEAANIFSSFESKLFPTKNGIQLFFDYDNKVPVDGKWHVPCSASLSGKAINFSVIYDLAENSAELSYSDGGYDICDMDLGDVDDEPVAKAFPGSDEDDSDDVTPWNIGRILFEDEKYPGAHRDANLKIGKWMDENLDIDKDISEEFQWLLNNFVPEALSEENIRAVLRVMRRVYDVHPEYYSDTFIRIVEAVVYGEHGKETVFAALDLFDSSVFLGELEIEAPEVEFDVFDEIFEDDSFDRDVVMAAARLMGRLQRESGIGYMVSTANVEAMRNLLERKDLSDDDKKEVRNIQDQIFDHRFWLSFSGSLTLHSIEADVVEKWVTAFPESVKSSHVETLKDLLVDSDESKISAEKTVIRTFGILLQEREDMAGFIVADVFTDVLAGKKYLLKSVFEALADAVFEGVEEAGTDWAYVLSTTEFRGTDIWDFEFRQDMSAEQFAVMFKQVSYRREQIRKLGMRDMKIENIYDVAEVDLHKVMGIYKLPWDEFCAFMDENYDAFHQNPDAFLSDPEEADISDMDLGDIDDEPLARGFAARSVGDDDDYDGDGFEETGIGGDSSFNGIPDPDGTLEEDPQDMLETFLDSQDMHPMIIELLETKIAEGFSLEDETIERLELLLLNGTTSAGVKEKVLKILREHYRDDRGLFTRLSYRALVKVLSRTSDNKVIKEALYILQDAAHSEALIDNVIEKEDGYNVDFMANVFSEDQVDLDAAIAGARFLGILGKKRDIVISMYIIGELYDFIEKVPANDPKKGQLVKLFNTVFDNKLRYLFSTGYLDRGDSRDLDHLVSFYSKAINAEHIDIMRRSIEVKDSYGDQGFQEDSAVLGCIGKILEKRHDLAKKIFSEVFPAVVKNREDLLETMFDIIVEAKFTGAQYLPEDWAVVLSTIRTEGIETFSFKYEEPLSAEVIALAIKQAYYRKYKAFNSIQLTAYVINQDDVYKVIGIYKLPWDEFCAFMDENYDAFHRDPEAFLSNPEETDISDMDFGDIDDEPVAKAFEFEASKSWLNPFSWIVENISKYFAVRKLERWQRAVESATQVEDTCFSARVCGKIDKILSRWPDMYAEDTCAALETVIFKAGQNVEAASFAGRNLEYIARTRKEYSEAAMASFEKILTSEEVTPQAHFTVSEILKLLANMDPRPFRKQTVTVLSKIFESNEMDQRTIYQVFETLSTIASNVPEYSDDLTSCLKDTLKVNGYSKDIYMKILLKLAEGSLGTQPSDIDVIDIVEGALGREDVDAKVVEGFMSAVNYISKEHSHLLRESTIAAMEKFLARKDRNGMHVADSFTYIAIHRPDLIRPETVIALKELLGRHGLEKPLAAYSLSAIAKINADYFESVYMIVRELVSSGDHELAEYIMTLPDQIERRLVANLKAEDWMIIAAGCPEDIEQEDLEDLYRECILARDEKESARIAISKKQAIYLAQRGREDDAHEVTADNVQDLMGLYKLPWDEFREFMDKNYDAFHRDPDAFLPNPETTDISDMDLGDIDDDLDSGVARAARFRKLHGLYVRGSGGNRTIYLSRNHIHARLDDFIPIFGRKVTVEQAVRFLDGHETFHVLIDDLRIKGNPLREISEEEEETLANLFGKAFAVRHNGIPGDLVDELEALSIKIGLDLVNIIRTAPEGLEDHLEKLGVDVTVEFRTPEEMGMIKMRIDEERKKKQSRIAVVRGVTKYNLDMLSGKQLTADQVTDWIEELIGCGEIESAGIVAERAVKCRGLKGFELRHLGMWADLLEIMSPRMAARMRIYQGRAIENLLKQNGKFVTDVFTHVHRHFSIPSGGLSWVNFGDNALKVFRGEKIDDPRFLPKHESFIRAYFDKMMGLMSSLSEREAELIRLLSMDISRAIEEARDARRLKSEGQLSFREGMRFMKIFSRYYLEDVSSEGKGRIFEYFTLTAWAVYGRFIRPENRGDFASILEEIYTLGAYEELFIDASIERGSEVARSEILNIFDFGTFEKREEDPDKLSTERKVQAAVERARAAGMPAFLFVPSEHFPDAVVESLSRESDSAVFPVTMTGFTQRKDFFGMHLPDENGDVKMFQGAIAKVVGFAKKNPDKQVYFVLENPDFASGDVRMALHQMLLERTLIIDDDTDENGRRRGEIQLPENMQIVLTMQEGGEISDESFMDRASGCHLQEPTFEEIKEYVNKEAGLDAELADFLVDSIYRPLKDIRNLKDKIKLQDIVQIGYFVKGRITDNDIHIPLKQVVRQEAALHLASKFSSLQEADLLKMVIGVTGDLPRTEIEISGDGKSMIFGGIRIDVDPSSSFGEFLRGKIRGSGKCPGFSEALEEYLPKDYFVTDMEKRIFCLMARVYKYAPSKLLFLQGLSGGGKTTIARIFLDITGCERDEYTLNKETSLSLFRGSLGLAADGLELRTAEYWKDLSSDKSGVVINEADTRVKLIQWLWPMIAGRPYRMGWEYASTDANDPFGKVVFGKGGMHVLSGNIRKDMPPILGDNMPATYCMERSEDDITYITEKMFRSRWDKLSRRAQLRMRQKQLDARATLLSGVYNAITSVVRKDGFLSKREVTPRQIERFTRLLFQAIEDGCDINKEFNMLLHLVFVTMWDNHEDMRRAYGIIKTQVADLPPPPSSQEILDYAKGFSLDIPVLVLTNGARDLDEIRSELTSSYPDAEEEIVPLSRFHSRKSLIGGINRTPQDHDTSNKLGILPSLILKARISGRDIFCWMPGYLNMNPQVAPFLNEFFQTGWLQLEDVLEERMVDTILAQIPDAAVYERLSKEFSAVTGESLPPEMDQLADNKLKRHFARFLAGNKPKNLLFRAIGTAEEPIALHAADVDRFFTFNVSEHIDNNWIKRYVKGKLASLRDKDIKELALKCVEVSYALYEEQRSNDLYPHNRLSVEDIKAFLEEIAARKDPGADHVRLLAYHMLGLGLTREAENRDTGSQSRDYREAYAGAIGLDLKSVSYRRGFIKEEASVYYTITAQVSGEDIELARMKTNFSSAMELDGYGRYIFEKEGKEVRERLQAPIQNLLAQQASFMLFASHGMGVVLEGDPGGGKTSGSRDISKATGRDHHEEGMYKWINLGSILGGLSIRGKDINDIVLNTLDKDAGGSYLLPFLRMYTEGGSYVADEGMVSRGAEHVLRWMTEASQLDQIDLGTYHPGLQGIVVKRDSAFTLTITQNDHFKTVGRKPIPRKIDNHFGKIRVDNVLSLEDAVTLMDYYLEGFPLDAKVKTDLARLHILLSSSHPEKRMVSPRDLVDTIQVIKYMGQAVSPESSKEAVFSAISVNYLEGLVDPAQRDIAEGLVRQVFPDFSAPDYKEVTISDRGHSTIDEADITHLKKSDTLMRKVKAMEHMLSSGEQTASLDLPPSRQVLVREESGASGVEFLKLFSHVTGRQLEVVEGHPFLTSKLLLTGRSFEFEDEFDENGVRRSKDGFGQTLGALRRHMIKKTDLESVPEEGRKPVIITITNVESVRKNELVKLNELIATRSTVLEDEDGDLTTYILPPWVTIVPVTSDVEQLTSPFANRFRKIGVPAITSDEEQWKVLSTMYPNLKLEETQFMVEVIKRTTGLLERFELGYDFTLRDVEEMALRLQMYKQEDHSNGEVSDDPFWYVTKSVNYVLMQAMCPEDKKIFIEYVMVPMFSERLTGLTAEQMEMYLRDLLEGIRQKSRSINWREYTHLVHEADFSGRLLELANGMKVLLSGDTLNIITGGYSYRISWKDLGANSEWNVLSEGLSVKRRGEDLIMKEKLLGSLGSGRLSNDEKNLERAVPMEEMGVDEFMAPTESLMDSISALLQAHTPVRAATGKVIRPRVVLMAGETGSGKTTIPKMLSKAEGTPLVRVNPWRQMQATNLTVSLSFKDTVQMNISDFLLACGTINGERVNAAYPTSNRIRVLVDEANVTRDVWYVLDAIARGEKRFYVETPAGDAIEVEMDKEVEIVLTYNPPERYGGTGKGSNRFKFPRPIMQKAVRIYTSQPMEDYSQEEMIDIMRKVYSRGEAYSVRQKTLSEVSSVYDEDSVPEGFFTVDDELFTVEEVSEPEVKSLEAIQAGVREKHPSKVKVKTPEEEEAEKTAQLGQLSKKFNYSNIEMSGKIEGYKTRKNSFSARDRFGVFMQDVLSQALVGIALEKIDNDILSEVLGLAGELDPDLASAIGEFNDLCVEEDIDEKGLKLFIYRIKKVSLLHEIYLEGLDGAVDSFKGRPIISYNALPIEREQKFPRDMLIEILGEEAYCKVFADHVPGILVLRRPSDGVLGYYNGRDLVCSFLDDAEKELEVSSHELGHYVSDKLAEKGDRHIAERLRKNVELYSHLFPVMMVTDPKKYFTETLLEKINSRLDDDDAYALASAHILNAFCIEYALPRVTRAFEEDGINKALSRINSLSAQDIRRVGIKIWRNPQKYFPKVEKGVYPTKVLNVTVEGQTQSFSINKGPQIAPNIKVVGTEDVKDPVKVDGTDEMPEKGRKKDPEGPGRGSGQSSGGKGGQGGTGGGDAQDNDFVSLGNNKELPETSRAWMRKYQQLFASDDDSDDLEVRFVSEGGTDINPEAWASRNADELLIAPEYEDDERSLAQNVFFVVDVSGSIQSNLELRDSINEMIRQYASFLLELSRKNPDLNVGLATISTRLDVLFDFQQWKDAGSHRARRELLEDSIERMWSTGTGGGLDTPVLLDALSQIEFPNTGAKDVKNLIPVFTDGGETGRAHGEELKEMVRSFQEGLYITPDGVTQVRGHTGTQIDMAFMGIELTDGGMALRKEYPCYLNVGNDSADAYIEALFKMAYMQAKGMPLDGDLSPAVRDLDKRTPLSRDYARSLAGYARDISTAYSHGDPARTDISDMDIGDIDDDPVAKPFALEEGSEDEPSEWTFLEKIMHPVKWYKHTHQRVIERGIEQAERTLSRSGLSAADYVQAARILFGQLNADWEFSGQRRKSIESIERLFKKRDIERSALEALIKVSEDFYDARLIGVYTDFIRRKSMPWDLYRMTGYVLCKYIDQISGATLSGLAGDVVRLASEEGLEPYTYDAAGWVISYISLKMKNKTAWSSARRVLVKALINMIKAGRLTLRSHADPVLEVLSYIQKESPELLDENLVKKVLEILLRADLDPDNRTDIAFELVGVLHSHPEYFRIAYPFIRKMVDSGDMEMARRLAVGIGAEYVSRNDLASLGDEDWIVVLEGIDLNDHRPAGDLYFWDIVRILNDEISLKVEDIRKIIVAKDPAERSAMAMHLKQKYYLAISRRLQKRELPVFDIIPRDAQKYIGHYKMPWDEFCAFMDEHYDEFHRDPDAFLSDPARTDISDMDLGDIDDDPAAKSFPWVDDEEFDDGDDEWGDSDSYGLWGDDDATDGYYDDESLSPVIAKLHISASDPSEYEEALLGLEEVDADEGLEGVIVREVEKFLRNVGGSDRAKQIALRILKRLYASADDELISRNSVNLMHMLLLRETNGGVLKNLINLMPLVVNSSSFVDMEFQPSTDPDLDLVIDEKYLRIYEDVLDNDMCDRETILQTVGIMADVLKGLPEALRPSVLASIAGLKRNDKLTDPDKDQIKDIQYELLDKLMVHIKSTGNMGFDERVESIYEIVSSVSDIITGVEVNIMWDIMESLAAEENPGRLMSLLVRLTESLGVVMEKRPDLVVVIWNRLKDSIDELGDQIAHRMLAGFVKGAAGIQEDWAYVLSSIEFSGWLDAGEIGPDDKGSLEEFAIALKQAYYRAARSTAGIELAKYKVPRDDHSKVLGVYKLSWDEFCSFMDENYEAFHQDPDAFISDPAETDISDMDLGDIDDEPVAKAFPRETAAEKLIEKLDATIAAIDKDAGAIDVDNVLKDVTNEVQGFMEKCSARSGRKVLRALERLLGTSGLNDWAYSNLVRMIQDIVQGKRSKLIDRGTVKVIMRFFRTAGFDHWEKYWVEIFGWIVTNRPDLVDLELVNDISDLMHIEGVYEAGDNRNEMIDTLRTIAENISSEEVRHRAANLLEGVLQEKGIFKICYDEAASAIAGLASVNPDMIDEKTIDILEQAIELEGLVELYPDDDASVEDSIATALGQIANIRPGYFTRCYSIAQRMLREGKGEDGKAAEQFAKKVTSKTVFLNARDIAEDWAVVIDGIDESVDLGLTEDEIKTLLTEPDHRKRTLAAIRIKQRIYRTEEEKDNIRLRECPVSLRDLSKYQGKYKLPWDEFCAFMDEHYDEFHQNPDAFISDPAQTDISDMDLGDIDDGPVVREFKPQVMRNITKEEELCQTFVDIAISKLLSDGVEKLVLAFDKSLKGYQGVNPLTIVEELEKLKEDKRYKKLLDNLVIIREDTEELNAALAEYKGKDEIPVFVFAPETSRDILQTANIEQTTFTSYIKDKDLGRDKRDFPMNAYYPLLEVVVITLAYAVDESSLANVDGIKEELNIGQIIPEAEDGVLVFELLPEAEEIDMEELRKKIGRLRRFMEAA